MVASLPPLRISSHARTGLPMRRLRQPHALRGPAVAFRARIRLAAFRRQIYTRRPAVRAAHSSSHLAVAIFDSADCRTCEFRESSQSAIHCRDPSPEPGLAAGGPVLCARPTGCVQRRLTIRSNPPGALVYVDDYQIGTTPVSTDFVYYGTRKIRLVLSGYETLTVLQPIPTPWYEYPGLDFVSENLVPGEIRDERVVDYPAQAADDRAQPATAGTRGEPAASAPPLRKRRCRRPSPSFGPPPQSAAGLPASPPPTSRPGGWFELI